MSKSNSVVYAGHGSSHSWTWLADLFEAGGIFSVRFLDSHDFILSVANHSAGIAIISGGDGFAIAESLKGAGFANLRRFVHEGGTFVGICAGAYLPLPSSIRPFSEFNISTTKIENIKCDPKPPTCNPREMIPYGSCSIVHPVRGPVEITDGLTGSIIAPLYGGPVFKEPGQDLVMMRYSSFTPKTEFQVDRTEAESVMIHKPSAIKVIHGKGSMLLLGPHLEHPGFPEANGMFLELIGFERPSIPFGPTAAAADRSPEPALRGSISDLKVAILGLENRSFTVGHKQWDGSRLLELASAIEERAWSLDLAKSNQIQSDLDGVRSLLVGMETGSDLDVDRTTSLLVGAARTCVDNHFRVLSERTRNAFGGMRQEPDE